MDPRLNDAIGAAKIAGKILMDKFGHPVIKPKNINDVVTDADVEAEAQIKKFLMRKYPNYGFIGEETGFERKDITWVVDPLDGTRAFCFGMAYFSVSIALVDGSKTTLGVVYNPATKERFTAERGKGAFLNGVKIEPPSAEKPIGKCLIGCAFRYSRPELRRLEQKAGMCVVGLSVALDVCRTAQGRIDGAVYGLTNAFDHAAAALVAQESGVTATNFGKNSWDPYGLGIIAARPKTHKTLSRMFPKPLEKLDRLEKSYAKNHSLING